MLPQAIAEFAGIEADARLVRSRCRAGESGPGTGGHITKPSWLHEHIRQPVTNLGRRLKFCFVLAYHISERERRSRTHEAETISGFSVLAVLHRWHVAVTSPMGALSWPAWTQRQTNFLPVLAEYLFGSGRIRAHVLHVG
jgi:hypothetical protein